MSDCDTLTLSKVPVPYYGGVEVHTAGTLLSAHCAARYIVGMPGVPRNQIGIR